MTAQPSSSGVSTTRSTKVGSSRLTRIDVEDDFTDADHGPCEDDPADRYVNGYVTEEAEASSEAERLARPRRRGGAVNSPLRSDRVHR